MKRHLGLTVTKYDVAKLTAKPYIKSLTAENLTSAFKKTGIYPFNRKVITASQIAPATIYDETPDNNETTRPETMKWTHHAGNQVTMMPKKTIKTKMINTFLIKNNLKFLPVRLKRNQSGHLGFTFVKK